MTKPVPGSDIQDFCIVPSSQCAYSAHQDGIVAKWCVDSGNILQSCQVKQKQILAIGADADHVYAVVDNEFLILTHQIDLIAAYRIPCNGLFAARISNDAQLVFLSRRDEGIQCFSTNQSGLSLLESDQLWHLPHRDSDPNHLQEGEWFCWQNRVPWHRSRPTRIALSVDGTRALTHSPHDQRAKIRAWDLKSGKCTPFHGYDSCFAIATDGRLGYAGRSCDAARTTTIMMFDMETGAYVDDLETPLDGTATALEVSPDGSELLIGFSTGGVSCCRIEKGRRFDHHSLREVTRRAQLATGVAFLGADRFASSSGHRLRFAKRKAD